MNRYIMLRRLRWPAILLLLGVVALLHQMGVEHVWHIFVPLVLILLGVFMLAERAVLSTEGGFPPYPGAPGVSYPQGAYTTGTPYPGAGDPLAAAPPPPAQPGTSIVPAPPHDLEIRSDRGGE